MRKKRRRSSGLGAPDSFHVDRAAELVDTGWRDLERMPPTCEGGIRLAARAAGAFERAQGHLESIEDRGTREAHSTIFGMRNMGASAAQRTLDFFSGVCVAPGGQARERPLTSRARAFSELEEQKQKNEKKKRRR